MDASSITICIPCLKQEHSQEHIIRKEFEKLNIGDINKVDIVPIYNQQKRFISNITPDKSYNKFTVFIHYNRLYETEHAIRIQTRLNKKKEIYICKDFDIWKCVKYIGKK